MSRAAVKKDIGESSRHGWALAAASKQPPLGNPSTRRLRKEMKLTQEEFGNKVKLHCKQVAKYETGVTIPSIGVIARIAKFCEIPTDYLIFGEDKALSSKTKIADVELMEYFRRVNKLKKAERDKIKWAIKSLLNGSPEQTSFSQC